MAQVIGNFIIRNRKLNLVISLRGQEVQKIRIINYGKGNILNAEIQIHVMIEKGDGNFGMIAAPGTTI